jgi:hypothetical protein
MAIRCTKKHLRRLLKRLGDRDSEFRYAAFQEADTLSDDELLALIACVRGSAWGSWANAEQGQAASWIIIASALIGIGSVTHMVTVTAAACALLLMVVVCLIVRQSTPAAQVISGSNVVIERSVARLLRHRTDARFLVIAISMYVQTRDDETRGYLNRLMEALLDRVDAGDRHVIRVHQSFFAKVLLRPLRDVKLTYAVLKAFEVAGSSKALAYVRALAFVFEEDLRSWDRHASGASRDIEITELDDPHRGRVRVGVRGNVWIRRREGNWARRATLMTFEDRTYVPHLGHLDESGAPAPAPELLPEDAHELRRIVEAARRCEIVMEERVMREEHASTLLKPSCRPGELSEELVRPARFHRESIKELLRPGVR